MICTKIGFWTEALRGNIVIVAATQGRPHAETFHWRGSCWDSTSSPHKAMNTRQIGMDFSDLIRRQWGFLFPFFSEVKWFTLLLSTSILKPWKKTVLYKVAVLVLSQSKVDQGQKSIYCPCPCCWAADLLLIHKLVMEFHRGLFSFPFLSFQCFETLVSCSWLQSKISLSLSSIHFLVVSLTLSLNLICLSVRLVHRQPSWTDRQTEKSSTRTKSQLLYFLTIVSQTKMHCCVHFYNSCKIFVFFSRQH